jgi:isopenicillin-N N-acyltransferase like protein
MSTLLTRRLFVGGAAIALSADVPLRYPLYRCAGNHRELGRQHGAQARDRVRAHVAYLRQGFRGSRDAFNRSALAFVPTLDRHCPHLVEEIRGLGEGAGVTFPEAIACNIRGEISRAPVEGCTAFAIRREGTVSGGVLVGQNSDLPGKMIEFAYVLHLKPAGKPEVLIWTFGGMIGYHGMNSAGVAQFANALSGGPAGRFAMPHYPVKRLILECRHMREVLAVFESVPLASNGNYVIADGEGEILDVEATTEGLQILRDDGKGYLAHTNHYLSPRYATRENYTLSSPDSFARQKRIDALLAKDMGQLEVEGLKRHLSDHLNGPPSICRHLDKKDTSQTVASIIAEPDQRRMHVAAGTPCNSRYVTYSLDE